MTNVKTVSAVVSAFVLCHSTFFRHSSFDIRHSPGGILSVALSLILRPVGITHHRVLWSPDFPLPGPRTAPPEGARPLAGQRPSGRLAHSDFIIHSGAERRRGSRPGAYRSIRMPASTTFATPG